jgi:hypothetical protein
MPFRRQRKITWVALIAMAIQLVVSFGHVHGYRLPHSAEANNLSAAVDGQGACAIARPRRNLCSVLVDAGCWHARLAGTHFAPSSGDPLGTTADDHQDRSQRLRGWSPGHRGAAPGFERAARQGTAAGSGRDNGLRRER